MKLIVLSLDAVGYNDLMHNKNLFPNIHAVIERGTIVKDVKTINPSLTYPIHTTIITGEYPNIHQVDHNIPFQPFSKHLKWNWYYKNIKSPTLIDVLNQKKMSTTSLFWPVTAGAKIKRCIPEIWCEKTGKVKSSLMLKYGSARFILKDALKHRKILNGKESVALDNFTYNVLMDILNKQALSDLTLVHFLSVDGAKHLYGNYSVHTKNAFITLDNYVGTIYEKVRGLEDTTLVILSDHTQIDVTTKIPIKEIFKKQGLLLNNDYIAYPRSCKGSCLVHIKHNNQKEQIKNKLRKISTATKGIKALYDLDEIDNISSQASFLLDASDGYYFSDSISYASQHGYYHDRDNYNVFMIAAGKNIKKSGSVDSKNLVDYAKTFARILNIEFDYGSGSCIDEIFKK
ncbi:MAG: alkaline phosphatase family protein [Bacilli bacterium]